MPDTHLPARRLALNDRSSLGNAQGLRPRKSNPAKAHIHQNNPPDHYYSPRKALPNSPSEPTPDWPLRANSSLLKTTASSSHSLDPVTSNHAPATTAPQTLTPARTSSHTGGARVSSPSRDPRLAASARPHLNPISAGAQLPSAALASQDLAPRSAAMDSALDLAVGDTVDVPGGMYGTVRYIGGVDGKNGVFAGVELAKEFAPRGKNDGDVDGKQYFNTAVPGAGIFLPAHRAVRQSTSPSASVESFPTTPKTPFGSVNPNRTNKRATTESPETPSLPKFSQSARPAQRPNFSQTVGPGARAPSPQQKKQGSRPSLPRPESPQRNASAATAPKPSWRSSAQGFTVSGRDLKPLKLSASMGIGQKPALTPAKPAASRSPSRGQASRASDASPERDSNTPTGLGKRLASNIKQPASNRPSLSATTSNDGSSAVAAANAESQRLKRTLEDRDKQLKEQAASLAEMESSLAELQSMVAMAGQLQQPIPQRPSSARKTSGISKDDADLPTDVAHLRALLREKNEKIALLTAEFDGHRADFRSTIDTLEMASTETERVYEKRVDELIAQVNQMNEGRQDVETVAHQLRQLEDLVAELEEGLEDARRGEAEARSEVEFLRGEVERSRSELRREREKAAKALRGANGAIANGEIAQPGTPSQRDIESRDDEIRGLKAIIHSLSSSAPEASSPTPRSSAAYPNGGTAGNNRAGGNRDSHRNSNDADVARLRAAMDTLTREKHELQGMVDRKTFREEELEREISQLRTRAEGPATLKPPRATSKGDEEERPMTGSSSADSQILHQTRDAYDEVDASVAPPAALRPNGQSLHAQNPVRTSSLNPPDAMPSTRTHSDSATSTHTAYRSTRPSPSSYVPPSPNKAGHDRPPSGNNPDTFHDASENRYSGTSGSAAHTPHSSVGAGFPVPPSTHTEVSAPEKKEEKEAPAATPAPPAEPPAPLTPDGVGDGPAPGKTSRRIDMSKWCAMCERDGHESVDCPFEEEY